MSQREVQFDPTTANSLLDDPSLKVLVVDDEPDALNITSFCLQRAGYTVVQARSGAEALVKARQEKPVLTILDRMMPEMDGLEVCQHLRHEFPEMYIVMLTALGTDNERIVGWEAGADDYIVKPFHPKELVLRIQAVLRRSRTARVKPTLDGGLTAAEAAQAEAAPAEPAVPATPEQTLEAILAEANEASQAGYMALARESYLAALEIDPKNTVALKWLAYRTVDPYEGCKYLERLVEVQPDNTKAQRLLDIGRKRCQELDQLTYSSILSSLKTGEAMVPQTSGMEVKAPTHIPLGELLVEKGYIDREHIETAASLQEMFRKAGAPRKLGEILVEYGYLTEDQLWRVLAEQRSV